MICDERVRVSSQRAKSAGLAEQEKFGTSCSSSAPRQVPLARLHPLADKRSGAHRGFIVGQAGRWSRLSNGQTEVVANVGFAMCSKGLQRTPLGLLGVQALQLPLAPDKPDVEGNLLERR